MEKNKICDIRMPEGPLPVTEFINHLDDKLVKKIYLQLLTLSVHPELMKQPYVKAFRLHKYKGLFELRTRIKRKMIRIIFSVRPDGTIILLHAFIKNSKRATQQALDVAKGRSRALASGDISLNEFFMEEVRINCKTQNING